MLDLFDGDEGYWFHVRDGDERAVALYRRHYSAKNRRYWPGRLIGGGSERLLLLTGDGRALWMWRRDRYRRDEQVGVGCAIFRNEGTVLSSTLVSEACEIAWRRWPGERLFTFVDQRKVRSRNPGYCFKVAGWRECGRTSDEGLVILEMRPEWAGRVAR